MRVSSINNTQNFNGLLSFPQSKTTLNPDNISDINVIASSFVRDVDAPIKQNHAEMVTEFDEAGKIKRMLYSPNDKLTSYYHGEVYLQENGEITMTNGDVFIFKGRTENLGKVFSKCYKPPIHEHFSDKSIINFINKAKKSDDIIELKDVLISKVKK